MMVTEYDMTAVQKIQLILEVFCKIGWNFFPIILLSMIGFAILHFKESVSKH